MTQDRLISAYQIGQALLISLLLLVGVFFTFGSYFEEYEIFVAQFFAEQFSYAPDFLHSSQHLGLFPLYDKVASWWPSLPVYSAFNALYLYILTSSLVLGFMVLNRHYSISRRRMLFLGAAFLLLFLDHLIFVNNVRIAMLMVFSSYLWLHLIDALQLRRRWYLLFLLLNLLGLSLRLEIHLIVTLLAVLFFVFWGNRRQMVVVSALLIVSAASMISLNKYRESKDPVFYMILKTEHILFDRENYSVEVGSAREFFRQKAIKRYILDGEVISMDDYQNVLEQENLREYLTNAYLLSRVYYSKIVDLGRSLPGISFLIVLCLLLAIGQARSLLKGKYAVFRAAAFGLAFLGLPLVLTVLVIVPSRFLTAYFSALGLLLLARFLSLPEFSVRARYWYCALLFLSAACFFKVNFSRIAGERELNAHALDLQESLRVLQDRGKTAVFAACQWHGVYSSKLFTYSRAETIPHYYLDFYFYHFHDFFREYNESFFGEAYMSMPQRLEMIAADDDIVFYSSDSYNQFLSGYLISVHDMEVSFEEIDYYKGPKERTYRVIIQD